VTCLDFDGSRHASYRSAANAAWFPFTSMLLDPSGLDAVQVFATHHDRNATKLLMVQVCGRKDP
jgi:hypothetical protein